ncbi:MAG: heparinase II/III-family protein [Saprospiraceae bacterium]|nr:heparinase II/III-family protein [Saprospiraceae bacterium]
MLLCSLVLLGTSCQKEDGLQADQNMPDHPRILLAANEEAKIHELLNRDPTFEKLHRAILKESNRILGKNPPERIMIGRRLLSTSREYLRRIFYLSYAYRMTADARFLTHAEAHLLKASSFSDWNPSHFLDVAEMTMGVAIGYDWLYASLRSETRDKVQQAILSKGLEPSYDSNNNRFLRATHNWNQVCNAGMVFGALALESEYHLTRTSIIERAMQSLPLAMNEYAPDGAYPEGYGYWGYGTTTNVMMLSALEKAGYSISTLTDSPGFLKTPEYLLHMLAPSMTSFNWGDNRERGRLHPAMFWFAAQRQDPSLLWSEQAFLATDDYGQFTGDRLLPALLLWSKDLPSIEPSAPVELTWVGQGKAPVALMRTSWSDPSAIYVGFKAGSPSVNHGHMDIGSFVLESDGIRWVSDLGVQNYESLESKGISVFGKGQDAERWTIFRMNNFSHSTLIVNESHQLVAGQAKIDRFSESPSFTYAVSDLTEVYEGQLKDAVRGIGIVDQSHVVLRDEIKTLNQETTVRWNLVTSATPEIADKKIILRKDGKQLSLHFFGPDQMVLKSWSTAPTNDYDALNPGTIMVGFEVELPANSSEAFEVLLVPGEGIDAPSPLHLPLLEW